MRAVLIPPETGTQIVDLVFDTADRLRASSGLATRATMRPVAAEEVMRLLRAVLSPAPAPKKKRPLNAMTEEEFIAYLEAEPSLRGVDVKKEIGKCAFWCSANGKIRTRGRVVNWLNKADRELVFAGRGQSSRTSASAGPGLREPVGWRQWLDRERPDSVYASAGGSGTVPWGRLDPTARAYIIAQMGPAAQVVKMGAEDV